MSLNCPDHRFTAVCACIPRHLAEAVRLFDEADALLKRAAALPDEQACSTLQLIRVANELKQEAIQEVRYADHSLGAPAPGAPVVAAALVRAQQPEGPATTAA